MPQAIEPIVENDIATSIEPMMLYMGRSAREAARTLALASTEQKNAALEAMARRVEARSGAIIEANRNDIEAARGKGRDEAFIDRMALDEARVKAMAKGLRDIAALPDPVGEVTASLEAAERLGDLARARAARGDRHHLRVAAERDGRCRRAVPQVRQRCDPARRLGELPHLARDLQCADRGSRRGGLAGGRDPARADGATARRWASCSPGSAAPST